ncbi:transketolase [Thermodesulfovibrio hydrogeniphilus]
MNITRKQLANAIRALSIDAIEKAKSGHPGAPLGMADIAEVLWNDFMKHNPSNPKWINRDRFVLSNGHASMLLYSLLHLTGYDVTIEDIKAFRQLHSKTAGHPEYGLCPGVETTTGPLGQGLANAVGMAIAEKILSDTFNRGDLKIIDHYTYVFCGDGDLMEGVAHEAISLAGTLGLGKLIVFWDNNGISIDGEVEDWFSEDVPKRFKACGWHVIKDVDGHNPDAIKEAIIEARNQTVKPTLICCKTIIGYGSPNKACKEVCHGSPLGEKEVELVRKQINWNYPPFVIPDDIYKAWDARQKGAQWEKEWNELFEEYRKHYPELAAEFLRRMNAQLPENFAKEADYLVAKTQIEGKDMATRQSANLALEKYASIIPELLGGSADLTPSNLTAWSGSQAIKKCLPFTGKNYIHYGVREFSMAAIMNGIALHGGFIPYGGTFLVFSDYARNAIRLSSMMKQRVIYVFTHDSIGVGEDGPTHQPVEHITSLRLIPGLTVIRPADDVEAAVAWRQAIERKDGPTCLVLSRQKVTHQNRTNEQIANIYKGGYILYEPDKTPNAIIIATGSEVEIAMKAVDILKEKGIPTRVVSMPSIEIFEMQEKSYKEYVLPSDITARVAVEAGSTLGWYKYVGSKGKVIGIDRFGESAPAKILYEYFGITPERVAEAVIEVISNK